MKKKMFHLWIWYQRFSCVANTTESQSLWECWELQQIRQQALDLNRIVLPTLKKLPKIRRSQVLLRRIKSFQDFVFKRKREGKAATQVWKVQQGLKSREFRPSCKAGKAKNLVCQSPALLWSHPPPPWSIPPAWFATLQQLNIDQNNPEKSLVRRVTC